MWAWCAWLIVAFGCLVLGLQLQVDDSVNASQDDAAATQDLRRGDVHVLKYRVIRPLVLADSVELI